MCKPSQLMVAASLLGAALFPGCNFFRPAVRPPHTMAGKPCIHHKGPSAPPCHCQQKGCTCQHCSTGNPAVSPEQAPQGVVTTVEKPPFPRQPAELPPATGQENRVMIPAECGACMGCCPACGRAYQHQRPIPPAEAIPATPLARPQPAFLPGTSNESQLHQPPLSIKSSAAPCEPVLTPPMGIQTVSHQDAVIIPAPALVHGPEKILISEKTTKQILHKPGEDPWSSPLDSLPAPPRSPISFGHSQDYRCLTGEIQRWRQNWRLRYAGVHEEDIYGGSVTLVGDSQLDQLKDGQVVRVRGFLTPGEGRHSSHTFRIQSLEVLDQ